MPKTSLYDPTTFDGIMGRLDKLTPAAERLWGTMTVAQMLAHVRKALETSFDNGKPARFNLFGFLMGPLIKKMVLKDEPYKKSLPTGKQVIVKDDRDFETEKSKLVETMKKFLANGPDKAATKPHPLFGKMTGDEWGFSQWKHLDHHLKQFGA